MSVPFLDPADKKSEYDSLIKTDLAFRAEIVPDRAAFAGHTGNSRSREPTQYGTSSAERTFRFLSETGYEDAGLMKKRRKPVPRQLLGN